MATFVLVHGAWGGSWGYTGIARALRAAGHEAFTPSLTGLGERSHLAHNRIDLSTHIQDVVNVLEYEDLQDVILCGHSYGGMVVTGVAARAGARIRTLFYLDAFLPGDGQALWDLADAPSRTFYIEGQRATPGLIQPMALPAAENAPPLRRLDPHPLLTLLEPVRLTGAESHVRNRTYVYATKGAPTIFTQFYQRLKEDPAWKVATVATGHVVMLEDPGALVRLLLEEVDR